MLSYEVLKDFKLGRKESQFWIIYFTQFYDCYEFFNLKIILISNVLL